MRSLIVLIFLTVPAGATVDYTKQTRLPCGQCHIQATGLGEDCLSGRWDRIRSRWAIPPKPMEECADSPGGELTPFGQMFQREDHTLK